MPNSIDLFNPLSEEAITNSILRAIWENDNARKKLAEDKLSLYKDDYEEIITEKIKTLFDKANYDRIRYHVNQSQNILKRVINQISTIYIKQVVRTTEDKRYQEILDENDFDVLFKRVNRYTNLFNECLVRVGVRFGKMAFDIITPNNTSVIQNHLDPTIADAIYYSSSRVNTAKRDSVEDIITYYYWDVLGNIHVYNQNWDLVEIVNDAETIGLDGKPDPLIKPSPYIDMEFMGIQDPRYLLPFVVYHRQFPDTDFWDETSGQDLYNSTVLTGVKLTEMDYHFKFSAFKQMYAVGDELNIPSGQIMDPVTMLHVKGEGASVGTLDTVARLEDMQKALIFQINTIINNYGISADAWTLTVGESSGRALKIRNQALIELRQDQLPLYQAKEKEFFNMIKVVNNAHAGAMDWKEIGKDAKVESQFAEIDFPEDAHTELRMDVKKLRAGLITPGKFYMRHNPEFTDEDEAEKALLKNLEILSSVKTTHPQLEEALIYILGQDPTPSDEGDPEQDEE